MIQVCWALATRCVNALSDGLNEGCINAERNAGTSPMLQPCINIFVEVDLGPRIAKTVVTSEVLAAACLHSGKYRVGRYRALSSGAVQCLMPGSLMFVTFPYNRRVFTRPRSGGGVLVARINRWTFTYPSLRPILATSSHDGVDFMGLLALFIATGASGMCYLRRILLSLSPHPFISLALAPFRPTVFKRGQCFAAPYIAMAITR